MLDIWETLTTSPYWAGSAIGVLSALLVIFGICIGILFAIKQSVLEKVEVLEETRRGEFELRKAFSTLLAALGDQGFLLTQTGVEFKDEMNLYALVVFQETRPSGLTVWTRIISPVSYLHFHIKFPSDDSFPFGTRNLMKRLREETNKRFLYSLRQEYIKQGSLEDFDAVRVARQYRIAVDFWEGGKERLTEHFPELIAAAEKLHGTSAEVETLKTLFTTRLEELVAGVSQSSPEAKAS